MQFGSWGPLSTWEGQVCTSKALGGLGLSGVSRHGGEKGEGGTRKERAKPTLEEETSS